MLDFSNFLMLLFINCNCNNICFLHLLSICAYKQRCEELKLLQRCLPLKPREATEEELLKLHTPDMISILKDTESISDEEALEKLSSKYDFLYIHPVRFILLKCFPH